MRTRRELRLHVEREREGEEQKDWKAWENAISGGDLWLLVLAGNVRTDIKSRADFFRGHQPPSYKPTKPCSSPSFSSPSRTPPPLVSFPVFCHSTATPAAPGPDEGSEHSSDVGISLRGGPLKTCFEECYRKYGVGSTDCKVYCLTYQG